MGQLADFSLDQMAGACALVLGSLGGLMLVLFKSNCLKIKCCFGLVQCTRRPPSIDDEDAQPEPEFDRQRGSNLRSLAPAHH